MNYLLDTVAINTYLEYKIQGKKRSDVDCDALSVFIEDTHNIIYVSNGTLLELLVKTFADSENRTLFINNKFDITKLINDLKILLSKTQLFRDSAFGFSGVDFCKECFNRELNPTYYINEKIKFECSQILSFFKFITIICYHLISNKFGDNVNLELFEIYIDRLFSLVENDIRDALNAYYYDNKKKEDVTKQLDSILFYLLTDLENRIKNREFTNNIYFRKSTGFIRSNHTN